MNSPVPSAVRVLAFLTALTGGVVTALALEIVLDGYGWHVAAIWRDIAAGTKPSLQSAAAWYAIVGATCAAGAVVAAVLARFPAPWRGLRILRWIAGLVVVFGLADIAHYAEPAEGVTATAQLLASGSVVIMAALMAMIGAVFALRARR